MARLIGFVLAVFLVAALFSWRASAQSRYPGAPERALHPSTEEDIIELRHQMQQELELRTPNGPHFENEEQAFRSGLRRAAANVVDHPRPQGPRHSEPKRGFSLIQPGPHHHAHHPPHPPQADWIVLLDSARRLEEMAHHLDMRKLWKESETLRKASVVLRHSARGRAQASEPRPEGEQPPHHRSEGEDVAE